MKAWWLAGVLSLVALQAAAACPLPSAPPVSPSGATASKEEMLAAQSALKAYNAVVGEYAQCMQKDGGSQIELDRVVKQLETLAVKFNAELRKFKQRTGAR